MRYFGFKSGLGTSPNRVAGGITKNLERQPLYYNPSLDQLHVFREFCLVRVIRHDQSE